MVAKKRIFITLSDKAIQIVKKHFSGDREFSRGVERCIVAFDENTITTNQIKFLAKKLMGKD